MARFPVLEIEKSVQVGDKTRLDGTKSFVSKGSTALTTLTVTPGADESAISVFSTDSKQWFLDWKFSAFKLDVDSTNNKINFTANGAERTATVADGTYTLSTLPAALKTALDAVGQGTFTVTVDKDEEITIESTVAFNPLPVTGANRDTSLLPILGFKEDGTALKTSYEGDIVDSFTRKITLTAGDGVSTDTEIKYIKIFSETGDALFSSDGDLVFHKHDVLKYVPPGRSSFKDVHRRAQDLILAWLDEQGYTNVYQEKFTKFDIVDKEEVRQWSTAIALKLIYRGLSNAIDDVFAEEAKEFAKMEVVHRNRSVIRLDIDKDKKADLTERVDSWSGMVFRR